MSDLATYGHSITLSKTILRHAAGHAQTIGTTRQYEEADRTLAALPFMWEITAAYRSLVGVTMTISTGTRSTKEREGTTHKDGVVGKDVLDNKGVKSVKKRCNDFVRWMEIIH